jgi:hypothetical protein
VFGCEGIENIHYTGLWGILNFGGYIDSLGLKAAPADWQAAYHSMGGVFEDTTTAISLQSMISMFQIPAQAAFLEC